MMKNDSSGQTIIQGVIHPMRDYYTRISVSELPACAERMVGTKLTLFGEEIGEVLEAWVENDIINYKAEVYDYSKVNKNDVE